MTSARVLRGAVIALAVVSPWSISAAEGALGVALLAWLAETMRARRAPWRSVVAWPLAAFAFVWVTTAIRGSGWRAGSIEATHQWAMIAAPVVAAAVADRLTMRRACVALLASETVLAIYCGIEYTTGRDLLLHRALEPSGAGYMALGTFSHHLTLAGHVLLVACVALACATTARTARVRFAAACAAAASLGALAWSFGRSAWIGAAAGAVVLCVGLPVRARCIAVGAVILLVGAIALTPPLRAHALSVIGDDVVGPRLRLWQTSARIIHDHALWGIGAGRWDDAFARYRVPGHYWATAHPHNDWLNVWVCSGVFGFIAFVWVWIAYARVVARGRRGHAPAALAGASACAALLVAGMFQCYQTDAEVAILLWAIVGATTAAVENRV